MRTRSRSCLQFAVEARLWDQRGIVRPGAPAECCCTVEMSLTLSARKRVTSWKRVKRSNSSGSKLIGRALRRKVACICDSAWISTSRM